MPSIHQTDSPAPAPPPGRLARVIAFLERVPWLIPTISFISGVIGFALVKRGVELARVVAVLALAGWLWLLIEPLVRRSLDRRLTGAGKLLSNFLSQSLQQEMLFFSLPFIFGAMQRDVGQIAYTVIACSAALLTAVDPLYERWIAARAATRMLFHAYCSLIAAVVVVPMVVLLPLEQALPWSLGAVGVWLLVTSPMALRSLQSWKLRSAWIVCSIAAPALLWSLRAHIPAAGLAITQAVITQSIDDLTPGPPVRELRSDQLPAGVIAFIAVRAPSGISQSVIFEWRHAGDSEKIVAEIRGGREEGFRTWSRKQIFPASPEGRWTVDILTPQGQLLRRMQFRVTAAG